MKPYQRSAIRRRFYHRLPVIKKIVWLITVLIILVALLGRYVSSSGNFRSMDSAPSYAPAIIAAYEPETPQPLTKEEMIKSLPHGDLVWKTYGHESTWGKNDICKQIGMVNGFGYGNECFNTVEEVAEIVSGWFSKHLQTMTVRQALCYYQSGKIMDNCDYASYTLNLEGGEK